MFKCKVCNVELFGIENYRVHMSGRKHKAAEAKAEGVQGTQGTPIPITVATDDASLAGVGDGAEFNCDVCNTKVFGKANYKIHIEGRKHLNKVKEVAADGGAASGHPTESHTPPAAVPGAGGDTYTCDYCETVIFGKANYDIHVQGKKHINKVKASTGEESAPGTKPTVTISDADDGAEFNCDVCNTKVFGKANYKIHIEGRKHLNKVKEAANGGGAAASGQPTGTVVPGGETYNCVVCETVIFGKENYILHMQGKKHLFRAALMKTEIQFMARAITSNVVGSPAARVKLIHPDGEERIGSDDDEDGSKWRSFSSTEKGNLFAITVEESYEGGIGHIPWFPSVPNSQYALHTPSYVVVDGVLQPKAACCKVVCSVGHTIPLLPHESLKLTDVELCGRWFDVLFGPSSSIGAQYRRAAAELSSSSAATSEAPGMPSDDDICVDWANFLFCEMKVDGDDNSAPKRQFHPRWRLTVQAVSQNGNSLVPPATELHQSGNLPDIPTARQLEEKATSEGSNAIRFPVSSPLTLSGNSDGDSVSIEITLQLLMSTTEAMYQGESWMEQFRLSDQNGAVLEGPVCRLYGIPC